MELVSTTLCAICGAVYRSRQFWRKNHLTISLMISSESKFRPRTPEAGLISQIWILMELAFKVRPCRCQFPRGIARPTLSQFSLLGSRFRSPKMVIPLSHHIVWSTMQVLMARSGQLSVDTLLTLVDSSLKSQRTSNEDNIYSSDSVQEICGAGASTPQSLRYKQQQDLCRWPTWLQAWVNQETTQLSGL